MGRSGMGRNGFLIVLFRVLGTLILLSVILTAIPLTIPSMMGYQMFHVKTGSMAPAIPADSVVYVKPADALDVKEGDVIAFYRGKDTIIHRVVENRFVTGEFVTKGDANEQPDLDLTHYRYFIGTVRFSIPVIGALMVVYASNVGKIYVLCFAVSGALFHVLANKMQDQ